MLYQQQLDAKTQARMQEYVDTALAMGAAHALVVGVEELVFDPRTILKCMFGCEDWGKGHTCPSRPGSPSVFEYEQILQRYRYGIIVHCPEKRLNQQISLELERRAFLDGYYFAFSLSDCGLCRECQGAHGRPCAFPKSARPAFHSVGIDVFATAHRLGLPLETLSSPDDPQNWYAFVFIE